MPTIFYSCHAENPKALKSLIVTGESFFEELVKLLRTLTPQRLESLIMKSQPYPSKFLDKLQSSKLNNLHSLCLDLSNVGRQGVTKLIQMQMPSLVKLELDQADVGSPLIRYLTKPKWDKLQMLYLRENKISIDGYLGLHHAHWPFIEAITTENYNSQSNPQQVAQPIAVIVTITWEPRATNSCAEVQCVQNFNMMKLLNAMVKAKLC